MGPRVTRGALSSSRQLPLMTLRQNINLKHSAGTPVGVLGVQVGRGGIHRGDIIHAAQERSLKHLTHHGADTSENLICRPWP